METIGERIERLREAAKISVAEMAAAAGVTLSALRQLETNKTKNPRPETLLGIARRLGVSMEEIVDPKSKRHPKSPMVMSEQAFAIAKWYDRLSPRDQKKLVAAMLTSVEAAPPDYVQLFLTDSRKNPKPEPSH